MNTNKLTITVTGKISFKFDFSSSLLLHYGPKHYFVESHRSKIFRSLYMSIAYKQTDS